jgi:isopentenyl diphosphate isomerase/L-lactate dehydrogenase-like FMN-dependent dehydrogenase
LAYLVGRPRVQVDLNIGGSASVFALIAQARREIKTTGAATVEDLARSQLDPGLRERLDKAKGSKPKGK